MARRKRQVRDIAFLEKEILHLSDILGQRNAELSHEQSATSELRRDLRGMEHQVTNYKTQAVQMGSRIGVLESDRDRLTTVVEVLARRLVSPAAEMDRSRAGWRSFTNAISPRDEAPTS